MARRLAMALVRRLTRLAFRKVLSTRWCGGEEVNPENWTCRNDSCWLQNVAGQCFLQIYFSSTMTKNSGNLEYKINRSNTHVHFHSGDV
jgi:hypothetical protein